MTGNPGFWEVAELRDALVKRELSVAEIASEFLRRIREVDCRVNAWITVDEDVVAERARSLDADFGNISDKPLYGVPVAIKDLTPTARFRTTFGSVIYKDYRPRHDALLVRRLEDAGALILGKTSTPEFGAGANTVNELIGATRNPWDFERTVGGSSGGSAAALASGTCMLAEGSDYGGSLRVPASFCGVLGLRTTPGLVPTGLGDLLWDEVAVNGPMARTVADLQAMLATIGGPSMESPLSHAGTSGWRDWENHSWPMRVAFGDGRALVDIEPAVETGLAAGIEALEEAGCEIVADEPDLSGIDEVIRVLRPYHKARVFAGMLDEWADSLPPGLVADIERGMRLSVAEIGRAQQLRSRIYARNVDFWRRYDAFVMPTAPCEPFRLEDGPPTSIGGSRFISYTDWMVLVQSISMLGWPALSVPSRPSENGLPTSVQLIGVQGTDWRLLSLAARYEAVMAGSEWRPPGWLGGRP